VIHASQADAGASGEGRKAAGGLPCCVWIESVAGWNVGGRG